MTSNEATLTASGIARLANVGRAAVSNWRRRYADFPTPTGGTPTSPLFDARTVEQWLHRHGRLPQIDTEQQAWRHIESYQPAAQINDVLGIAGAYLLIRAAQAAVTEDDPPTPEQLVADLRALDPTLATLVGALLPKQWTSQLAALLSTLARLGSQQDPETAFEYLHSQYVTSAQTMSGLVGTPDGVADLMLTLAGTGPRTFDFTSGTGSLLRMAADRALAGTTPTRCYAQEINPQYALITLLRLWFVHLRARRAGQSPEPPVVKVGDSLLADALPELRADVVVANFPFGVHDWGHERLAYDPRWAYGLPPRTEPELAWVQHALAHLSPSGTAVLLMPPAAASRPAGRRIRAELIRRGALRAVIALPAGLMPPSGIGLHIWVFTQPSQVSPSAGDLLLVDTTVAAPDHSLRELVTGAWDAYANNRYEELPGVHRTVQVIDILDDQVDLTPRRHLPRADESTDDPAQTLATITEFAGLLRHIAQALPPVRPAEEATLREAPRADVADLIRSGVISVQRMSGSRSTAAVSTVALTAADILSRRPASGAITRAADSPGPQVNAGDILIPVVGRTIDARVATPEQVGAELGPGLQLVRVDESRFDPWFVAGVISCSDNLRVAGRASSAAGGALRIDIRRLTIPVLPLKQQQAYGDAFRRLAAFRTTLDHAAEIGAALAREISDALTTGTLELSP